MSKISKAVASRAALNGASNLRVENFMGGDSYTISDLEMMKMVTASSIFGEPSYYRNSRLSDRYLVSNIISEYSIIPHDLEGDTTEEIMVKLIDTALNENFKATLDWAVELRTRFNMRLNPQVIMVRAALHPKRKEFTSKYPGLFDEINQRVMTRGDDVMSQMSYYMYEKGGKNNIPNLLKRSWKNNIDGMKRYSMAKYKNHEIGMINAVRICHASKGVVPELMSTGTVKVQENQETWERMRSAGKTWAEILTTVKMGHMALLRNIRGFMREVDSASLVSKYMNELISGVEGGKQFPFRYYRAYIEIDKDNEIDKEVKKAVIRTLDKCMSIAVGNLPRIKGKTMCLSDNSGSAWGGFTSEYGETVVAEIDNISSVIAAMCSDEGYVGKFGDTLKVIKVDKQRGVLEQAMEISNRRDFDVGGSTEGGIWEFFSDAIRTNEHWDNIFIFSDQQAGHGGLYGTNRQITQYRDKYAINGDYINVFKLVIDYRRLVNKKVNVFSIQTAGYNNVVIPEYAYRTNIMYGWTGKEVEFAAEIINQWNKIEGVK